MLIASNTYFQEKFDKSHLEQERFYEKLSSNIAKNYIKVFTRKIIVFENVSLDGYFAGPTGEIDWFVAHTGNQAESDEYAIDSINSIDMLLFGRMTYELMASYWPTADAMKNEPGLAERLNNLPKIVFSRTLDKIEWHNTRLIEDDIEEEIGKMKDQPGKAW